MSTGQPAREPRADQRLPQTTCSKSTPAELGGFKPSVASALCWVLLYCLVALDRTDQIVARRVQIVTVMSTLQ